MKLRWKLLIILLAISVIPMFALSITTRTTSHGLVQEMTTRSRELLILRAEQDLLRIMEDHARIISRERQIVNLALKAQSGRLRQILEGRDKQVRVIRNRGVQDSTKHFVTSPDGTTFPVKVNLDKVLIFLTEDANLSTAQADQLFQPMLRPFQKLEKSNPDLIYWQLIRLTNGIIATYPYYDTLNMEETHAYWMNSKTDPEISQNNWYELAKRSPKSVFWTPPFRDPVTNKLVVAAVAKIKEFKGPFYGSIMVMVPLGTVLKGKLDITGLSNDSTSFLVHPDSMNSGEIGLKVVAEEHVKKRDRNSNWMEKSFRA